MDRTAQALEVMTREDPELATRLFLQMLPAAAQRLEGPLSYDLEIDRLGTWRVEGDGNGGGGGAPGGGPRACSASPTAPTARSTSRSRPARRGSRRSRRGSRL